MVAPALGDSAAAIVDEEAAGAVPPLPPLLRSTPQRRAVGRGKVYATMADFHADLIRWEDEKRQRAQLVKQRTKALDKLRDRSSRTRDTHISETDSQRRVRERQESESAACAHADREFKRRAAKRKAAQLRRVQVDQSKDLTVAVHDCIVHAADDAKYAEARSRLVRLIHQSCWAVSKEGWPCGCAEWDAQYVARASEAPSITPSPDRPAFERWHLECLMGGPRFWDAYDAEAAASEWDAWLMDFTDDMFGEDIVEFILAERAKCETDYVACTMSAPVYKPYCCMCVCHCE